MSGPKRNPDKLNTIGVVVVGVCGAVLVYVSIVALQAFYMNDTSELQTMADYGGQDQTAKGKRADELRNITEAGANPGGAGTYRVNIEHAMKLVIEDAKRNATHLGGSKLPPATKESIPPAFGRPKMGGDTLAPPAGGAPPAGDCDEVSCVLNNFEGACCEKFKRGAGGAPAPAGAPAGAPGRAGAGTGAVAPNTGATGTAAPQAPTGTGPTR